MNTNKELIMNTNKELIINGGKDMELTSFILKAIQNGYDTVYISNYTLEEWKSFKEYVKDNRIRCVTCNEEYVQRTQVYLSERSIKTYYDICFDRPREWFEEKTTTYAGSHVWGVPEEKFIKAHGNVVRGCGTIIHTSNKCIIK